MELIRTEEFTQPGKVAYVAQGKSFELNSNRWLEILEVGPDAIDAEFTIFNQGPPPGKRWDVYINMSVIERDE